MSIIPFFANADMIVVFKPVRSRSCAREMSIGSLSFLLNSLNSSNASRAISCFFAPVTMVLISSAVMFPDRRRIAVYTAAPAKIAEKQVSDCRSRVGGAGGNAVG